MKKHLLILCALFLALSVTASAHSGRTDWRGGHYVRGTGEYHYHHGYPAHQHTNGICPYNYHDKTGENSGGSSENSDSEPSTPIESDRPSFAPSPEKPAEKTSISIVVTIFIAAYCLMVYGPLIFGLCYGVLYGIVELIKKVFFGRKLREAEEKRLAAIRQQAEEERRLLAERLQTEHDELVAKYSNKTRTQIAIECGMPSELYMDEKDLPHDIPENGTRDRCTVYIARKGSVYHCNPRCHQASLIPTHILRVRHLKPCRHCNPRYIPLDWYKTYKDTIELMHKHGMEPIPDTDPEQAR